MAAAASVVVVVGTVTGTVSALQDDRTADRARPLVTDAPVRPVPPAPSSASPSPAPSSAGPTPSASAVRKPVRPSPRASRTAPSRTSAASGRLYRHPASQVADWVADNPGDPRHEVIASRIAARPAAVWFTDARNLTARVRAVTSGGAERGRVPVVVAYAIPDRDCGGASQGGASDTAAYDRWIGSFAAGLGTGEVVVILEPDAIAQADCLTPAAREERFAALARAGRVLKSANPRARVYHDAGHSRWNTPGRQAGLLRRAGAASAASSDGVFSNVSNFNRTADEVSYTRRVLDALGGPAGLGAVIDTSRNGNGPAADGEWCDPPGRALGRTPTLDTGEARIDGYLWVKLPGESDGCRGAAGTFSPDYAYDLAR